jgi:hypothetical protein
VIPLVCREVLTQAGDAFGKQRDLHFGRTRVLGPAAELRENSALFLGG